MSTVDLSNIANVLRPVSNDIIYGREKLCLSTLYLDKLNNLPEEHEILQDGLTQDHNGKDIPFLTDLIRRTVTLKIIPDQCGIDALVDLSKFKSLRNLEIYKINVNNISGIQKVRSQIQNLSCSQSLENLSDVLDKCGKDKTQRHIWNELKKGIFSYNTISTFEDSFECTPWLQTLDLSHNQISNIPHISNLPNLKYLNLSYNKLEQVPKFRGQLCTRLQILILSNNFIEDVVGIATLQNVTQLDLSHNCLVDHNVLIISHLLSLQYLNLQGNPLCYHPQHRRQTCSLLHKNTVTLKFVLDNLPLSLEEKSYTGTFCQMLPHIFVRPSNSDESVATIAQEKSRRVRQVTIEDNDLQEAEEKSLTNFQQTITSSPHLEIKRQVEQLRKEFGDSWLYRDSGLAVQDVLGFQKTSVLSSTPAESDLDSLCIPQQFDVSHKSDDNEQPFVTATSQTFFTAQNTINPKEVEDLSDLSDGEDMCSGDEGLYLASNADEEQIFVVLTDTHISERDVTTSKEKARWHVNTIISCERIEDNPNKIKLDFDTVRRDRKQRIYEIENIESFHSSVQEKISRPTEKTTTYQCMKCLKYFVKKDKELSEGTSLTCPNCKSNHIIESM